MEPLFPPVVLFGGIGVFNKEDSTREGGTVQVRTSERSMPFELNDFYLIRDDDCYFNTHDSGCIAFTCRPVSTWLSLSCSGAPS